MPYRYSQAIRQVSTMTCNRVNIKSSKVVAAIVIIMITITSQNIFINSVDAETGKGTDIFRVIMTVFGVENTKGDLIALVSVNNGEASRVKFLETEAFEPVSANLSSLTMTPTPDSNIGILEYVATFPNITVNTGTEFKACVMTTKDLELLCKTGHNSPASRPEFADINLDEATASGTEQLETEEQEARIEGQN
jgi:hypothetical protein